MKRKEILDTLFALLKNSNVDYDSKLYQNALAALLAISLNEIEED